MGVFVKMVIDILETAVQMAFRSGLTQTQVRTLMMEQFNGVFSESIINRVITKIAQELALSVITFFC